MSTPDRYRLLVIDDDIDGAESLAELLSVWDHDVSTAHDAAGALQRVAEHLPQVAFVDVRLGRDNGIELISQFKSNHPDTLSIVITANTDRESAIAALRAGAHDYLCKPIDADDLRAALDRSLGQYRLVEENKRIWAELHEAKAHAERLAHTDSLTGLSNRAGFYRNVSAKIDTAIENGHRLPLLLIDLDGFKQVNDRHGHLIGDELLRCVADRMRGTIAQCGQLSRLGGDEFALVCNEPLERAAVRTLATRILEQISQPYSIQSINIEIGASIGSSFLGDDGSDLNSWFHAADTALYAAKAAGKGRHEQYSCESNQELEPLASES